MAGQIISRGKSTWLVRVFLGRDPDTGKRRYHNKTIRGNKKDAEGVLTDLLKSRNAGLLSVGSESLMIGELIDDVVRDYRINGQSVQWAGILAAHLRPMFGTMAVSSIRTKHRDKYIDQRRSQGRANSTINRELSMLRRAFSLAVEKGTLSVAPIKIPKLAENNVRKGFFEHSEYTRLRDALPAELKPVLTFAYYTGCRIGEILGLQWRQVDLIARIVRLEVGETKSGEGRVIPLQVEELYQGLVMLKAAQDRQFPDCSWVFARGNKQIRTFRRAWFNACEYAELWDPAVSEKPDRIVHDLRRTGVRNLIRAGVPEKVAMMISGHKTRSIFDRYNIVDERDAIEGMARLDRYSREREAAEANAQRSQPQGNWHTGGTQAS
jgi:integrase